MRRSLILTTLFFGLSCAAAGWSQDAAAPPSGELDALISGLDSPEFAKRQAATERLSELGSAAFPMLEVVAKGDSREASQRALEILKRHHDGDDTATKQAASEALQRLADVEGSRAGRAADAILHPVEPLSPEEQLGMLRGPIRFNGGNLGGIQVQIGGQIQPGGANVMKRITVRNNNGVKAIEAEENGRKVKIVDDPANGIEVEVTETKNGQPVTQKYAAKNADELKQKHPEAHQIYEQYRQQNIGLPIQAGGGAPQIPLPPTRIPGIQLPVAPAERGAAKRVQLDVLKRSLDLIDRQVQRIEGQDVPGIEAQLDALKRHRSGIERMLQDVEQQP